MSSLGWKVVISITMSLSTPHDIDIKPVITTEIEEVRISDFIPEWKFRTSCIYKRCIDSRINVSDRLRREMNEQEER